MGLSGISPGSLILIILIILLIFGTSKLKNIGEDLGQALKGFKKGLKSEESNGIKEKENEQEQENLNKKQQIKQKIND